jgi:hypothetical protein
VSGVTTISPEGTSASDSRSHELAVTCWPALVSVTLARAVPAAVTAAMLSLAISEPREGARRSAAARLALRCELFTCTGPAG